MQVGEQKMRCDQTSTREGAQLEDGMQQLIVAQGRVANEGKQNGATVPAIKLMIENAFPLSVKAAGGGRTYQEALEMIALGVKRIGTSSAKAIASGEISKNDY